MPDGLTYLSLRCVLEYLDANKRIHITGRSPALQKFEKSIPLHLDQLTISNRSLRTNRITLEAAALSKFKCYIGNGQRTLSRLTYGIEWDVIFKKALSIFLDDRRDVYVNHLQLLSWNKEDYLMKAAAKTELKIRKLQLNALDSYYQFSSFVHPSSFPLKMFKTGLYQVEDFHHDFLKSAEKLVILLGLTYYRSWFLPSFANLTNTKIVIEMDSSDDQTKYFRLIQAYLQLTRKIGSRLTICSVLYLVLPKLMIALKSQLNATDVTIKMSVEGSIARYPCFISVNTSSVALIYGIPQDELLYEVKVEIVPIDAVTPVVN